MVSDLRESGSRLLAGNEAEAAAVEGRLNSEAAVIIDEHGLVEERKESLLPADREGSSLLDDGNDIQTIDGSTQSALNHETRLSTVSTE